MLNSLNEFYETTGMGKVKSAVSGSQTYDFRMNLESGWMIRCVSRQRVKIETTILESSFLPSGLKIPSFTETVFEVSGGKVDSKEVKVKKPRVSKEIPSNERCIALKADGGRCKMKKTINGVEPDLCVSHNKNGTTKNGRLPENELADEVAEDPVESEIEQEDDSNKVKIITPVEKKTKNKKIGIIGTRSTIGNKAYSKEIKNNDSSIEIFEKACPLFVPLAEEGWTDHQATIEIAEEYLGELRKLNIDTLVLGCTHYPILSNIIQKVMGDKVTLIDSGIASTEIVKKELKQLNLQNDSSEKGTSEFYVSDIPTTFKSVAELFLGRQISDVHKVDLNTSWHS